jgi:hypothetical protein
MCGEAIWQMKRMFEEGLAINPGDEKIAGLLGELLFVRFSDDMACAIDLWHSSNLDKYDFSSDLFKVDVKSTFGSIRKHHFTSNQIRGLAPDRTFIASFMLERVEVGLSISDIVELITEQVDIARAQKVHEICLKTLGVPGTLIKDPEIDFGIAKERLRIYSSHDIPMPSPSKGVISMEWMAELDEEIKYGHISDFNEAFSTLRKERNN